MFRFPCTPIMEIPFRSRAGNHAFAPSGLLAARQPSWPLGQAEPRRYPESKAPVRFCQSRGLKPYGFDGANCHPDARADLIGQVRS